MCSAKNCTVGQYSTYDHVQGMLAGRVEGSSECVAKFRVSSLEFRVSSFEYRRDLSIVSIALLTN